MCGDLEDLASHFQLNPSSQGCCEEGKDKNVIKLFLNLQRQGTFYTLVENGYLFSPSEWVGRLVTKGNVTVDSNSFFSFLFFLVKLYICIF